MRAGLTAELGGPARPLGLGESARVVGGLAYVEQEAHRALGAISATGSLAPPLSVWAANSALAHAWRAGQLQELLPVSVGLPGGRELVSSPGALTTAWLAELPECLEDPSEQGRRNLEAWYDQLAAGYAHRLAHPHPSADGPLRRVFRRLLADLGEASEIELTRAWQSA